ncbi:alkaline phosphatase family protein [Planctomycetota bacterium]
MTESCKTNHGHQTKVMVIGMDGATFDVINPLISQGKLPHLQSLIQEGVSGPLKSTLPPLSAAAWSTFQTGKNPGKHGIFDFLRNCPGEYSCTVVNSTFLKSKTLWEILSENRRSVGVLNVMFNYPPREVNGFIVSGKETPDEQKEYTYPRSLKQKILQFEPKYQAEPFRRVYQTKSFLKKVPVLLKRQERVNSYLLNKYSPDFFMNLFAIPDIIHHLFWKYIDSSHPHYCEKKSRQYLPLIERCYQTLDDIVGGRMQMVDKDTVVIIMSDHGGGGLHKIVQLNRWLKEQGLLSLKEEPSVNTSLLSKSIRELTRRLHDHLVMHDSFGFIKKLKLKTIGRRQASAKNAIDWPNTKAFAGRNSEHGIYCNVKGREKEGVVSPGKEYEELREFIILQLRTLTDSETGLKIFKHIYKREEIYMGPYVLYAPDIILDFGNNPYVQGTALLDWEVIEEVRMNRFSGMHRPDGILIARGKGIKKGTSIQGACIYDLAPTILYMMGVKIPLDMDGKVLYDLFEPSLIDKNVIEYEKAEASTSTNKEEKKGIELTYSDKETEEIEERLRSLGYL